MQKEIVMKKNLSIVIYRRMILVILILFIQVVFLALLVAVPGIYFRYVNIFLIIISIIVSIHVLNKNTKAAYKLTWIFIVLLFPVFGGIMYMFFYLQANPRRFRRLIEQNISNSQSALQLCANRLDELIEKHPEFKTQSGYLQEFAGFPVFSNTRTHYFDSGEAFFKQTLIELEKAQRYIFLEFFILEEGLMLDPIISILERKAKEGLDVRLIYDDFGCITSLPSDFKTNMEKKGIKCFIFNPFRPLLSSLQNNRDHRKIISIDGKVAFTGSMNIADEYINAVDRFGHWKDAAIMLEGEGAWAFTMIFLQMWNTQPGIYDRYVSYFPWADAPCNIEGDGFVQPYADSPVDHENVSENVYIQIINNAKKYVYINTPYLILDDNLLGALQLAAKSGVDVRIITPHRWDKWYVAVTSRSYYRQLISAGVKVYEYTLGFNHGKTFACDDAIATVGTTNLDYRSLYLHFECGVVVYHGKAVLDLKDDFLRTIPVSHEISLKDCSRNIFQIILSDVLRIFAPLM